MTTSVLTNIGMDPVNGIWTAVFTTDSSVVSGSIFCGFKPRMVKCQQITGTVGNTAFTSADTGMTAGYFIQTVAGGTTTIVTLGGYTFLSGSEASPYTAMTNSPGSNGPGIQVGASACVTASAAYRIELYR